MKPLTSNNQLNAKLGIVAAHARLTSFGLISNKDLFMDVQEQEAAKERAQDKQDSFERLSEQLYLIH